MCLPVFPSPKGLLHFFFFEQLALAALTIFSGSVPASTLDPTWSVSGLSVLSRRVTHGTWRMQVSSWTPPESVKTSWALLSSCKNDR